MNPGNSPFRRSHFGPSFSLNHFKRTVRLGFKSLWLHRLRSLLTVLGIVFGVCSVIAMLAVGEGASYQAQQQIRELGSNNIIIQSIKPPEDQKASSGRSRVIEYGITYADVDAIQHTIPSVTVIVPSRIIREHVYNKELRASCDIIGTVPWYPDMRKHSVAYGRFFNSDEIAVDLNVCVLGATAAEFLFPVDDPLGKHVKVASDYYRVIGVMEQGGPGANPSGPAGLALAGASPNKIYIPLSAARNRFGEILMKRSTGSFEAERVELHEVTVQVAEADDVLDTSLIVDEILARNHKKKDYDIVVPLQLLRQAERTKQIFNIVLGAIAAISLLVGGIGIMNIMLASVTERTREIGIRRALGAKRRDIILQFVVETVILSGAGGLIGVALGVSIPFFITLFADMVTVVTPWSPLIAFTISALVGLVFGIYPALRAANMDPVEALRHE